MEFILLVAAIGNVMGVMLGNLVTGGGVKTIIEYIPIFMIPFPILAGFVVNTGMVSPDSDSLGIFSFIKYISPLKYLLEIILRTEFEDSKNGMMAVNYYAYNEGIGNCRMIILSIILGCLTVSYLMYSYKVSKNA